MKARYTLQHYSSRTVVLFSLLLVSCNAEMCTARAGLRDDPKEHLPMQPMAYTEYLDATPEGTAVRERRIAHALLDGSEEKQWGDLKPAKRIDLSTPKKLQQAFVKALFSRDEGLWDALFIEAEDYASLVNVSAENAAQFVDEVQAKSSDVWKTFAPASAADGLPGGFGDVFNVQELQLGHGRTLSGRLVNDGEQGEQFWGSTFYLKWNQQRVSKKKQNEDSSEDSVRFKISLPKIIRLRHAGVTRYQLAGPVSVDDRIHLFLRIGLHLKPQLMRSTEYPIPITVGNYWRYRRYIGEKRSEAVDPFKLEAEDAIMMVEATRAVDEILRVSDYSHWKLVELRRSHNDTELTKVIRWWLIFPHAIYLCNRYCRSQIEHINSLLNYISTRLPIYVFPIRAHMEWTPYQEAKKKKSYFSEEKQISTIPLKIVTSAPNPMTTGAGTFEQIIRMTGPAYMDTFPVAESGFIDRDFVWGKGIVRRFSADENLTEELIELRVR